VTAEPGFRSRPGQAELRSYRYWDNSGLTVTTLGLAVEQPVTSDVTLVLRGLVDKIEVEREQIVSGDLLSGSQATGHQHADVVTSASATVSGGEVADKYRYEAVGGARVARDVGGVPGQVELRARYSTETDYESISVAAQGSLDLFERNTTLGASIGYGRDRVEPVEAPPGQQDEWPATHERATVGASVTQLLSPRVALSGGLGATMQRGQLANPYRRAIVRTSLFPEVVPDERDRLTAFVSTSIHLGWSSALTLRQGLYADSWGVLAMIPEAALSKSFGPRLLATARARFYAQRHADFYEPAYNELEPLLSGDARLDSLREQSYALEARWTFLGRRDGFGSLSVLGGYEHSLLDYAQVNTERIVGRIVTLALFASY